MGSLVLSFSASVALCSFSVRSCASSRLLFSWFYSLCFDDFGCVNFYLGASSFACFERLCQRCSLFFLLFNLALQHAFCFQSFVACVLMILAARISIFYACSFSCSERFCQRCSLFVLLFNLAPRHVYCFDGFERCASIILTTLFHHCACFNLSESLCPLVLCMCTFASGAGAGGASADIATVLLEKLDLDRKRLLATIRENHVMVTDMVRDTMGAVKDEVNNVRNTINGWRLECNMSKATNTHHGGMFEFEDLKDDMPPMVSEEDPRIQDLLRVLNNFRLNKGYNRKNEAACRENAVDKFFGEVAKKLKCDILNSDDADSSLIVRVGKVEFTGQTDLIIGQKGSLPLLSIEIKPMEGSHRLNGNGFSEESFSHRTQIVLQCAAFQAQCGASATAYSGLLTNLISLYVVKIKSYDANTVSARVYGVVQDGKSFVRAVLRAADDNSALLKVSDKLGVGPLICEAANGFDSDRRDPAVSGIPQFPNGSTNVPADQSLGGDGGCDEAGLSLSAKTAPWTFEHLLPTHRQQKSDVRPNFTRTWVRLSAREHLQNLCNAANVESTASAWE